MNKEQIIATIVSGAFNNTELDEIFQSIQFARNRIAQTNTFTIRAGHKVRWSGRAGKDMVGIVTKVNTKTIMIDAGLSGRWRVSANMVSLVE